MLVLELTHLELLIELFLLVRDEVSFLNCLLKFGNLNHSLFVININMERLHESIYQGIDCDRELAEYC